MYNVSVEHFDQLIFHSSWGMCMYIANSMESSHTQEGGRDGGRREHYICLHSDCVERYRLSNVMWWQKEFLHNNRQKVWNGTSLPSQMLCLYYQVMQS